ncbi:hypothetical protein [Peribacillus loiseleuriae]|nr:hypothetical protein [Peribacillus loiseleuriae]
MRDVVIVGAAWLVALGKAVSKRTLLYFICLTCLIRYLVVVQL